MHFYFKVLSFVFWACHVAVTQVKTEDEVAFLLSQYEKNIAQSNKLAAAQYLERAAYIKAQSKQNSKALEYYEVCKSIYSDLHHDVKIIDILYKMAQIQIELNNKDIAKKLLEESINARQNHQILNKDIGYDIYKDLGKLYLEEGKYIKAIQYFKVAADFAKEVDDNERLAFCYGNIAEAYEKNNEILNALFYYKLYRSTKEQAVKAQKKYEQSELEKNNPQTIELQNEKQKLVPELHQNEQMIKEQSEKIEDLDKKYQAIYDSSSKKSMMLRLINQEAQSKLELDKYKQKIVYTVFTFGMLLLLVLGVFLFFSYRNNIKIKKMNELLTAKNEEIKSQKQQIENQNKSIIETAKMKDKLFSVLAHDLRSPFATLETLMILYELEQYDEQKTKELMLQIKALSHNTLQTLDNTLDWVKTQINSGYVAMQSNVALYSATEEVIDFLHNMASAKKINIKNLIPETTLAYVDLNHYKIIVRNLIANAIKFSHENSEILVSASTNPNGVILSIKDFGVGMSEESINKLFNPNTHFSTKGTNDEKGTGLGLMLCKELLDKNKAQIEIKSTLGKGTEFMVIFALPKNMTEQS